MTGRLRPSHVEWVAERLSERDWQIIEAINNVRLLTGKQIEQLFFADLASSRSRTVSRARVLQRLVAWRVLVPLPRRIGGAGSGSTTQVFALDSAGQRLMHERLIETGCRPRVRRPGPPGDRTIRHILAVSDCLVALTVSARTNGFRLVMFQAEPACWWPGGLGGYLKPDAYAVLESPSVTDHWWLEVDLATESLPALKRQLLTYLDFAGSGQRGPGGVMPRIAIAAITPGRVRDIQSLVRRLPEPATDLFCIMQITELANSLYQVLLE